MKQKPLWFSRGGEREKRIGKNLDKKRIHGSKPHPELIVDRTSTLFNDFDSAANIPISFFSLFRKCRQKYRFQRRPSRVLSELEVDRFLRSPRWEATMQNSQNVVYKQHFSATFLGVIYRYFV